MCLRHLAPLLAAPMLIAAAPAAAEPNRGSGAIRWSACGDDAPGWDCSTVRVPFDWGKKGKQPSFDVAVTRLPASGTPSQHRGPLFVNFGGPGAGANDALHAFGADLFAGLTSATTSSASTRAAPAGRCRRSTARSTRSSRASTRSRSGRPRTSIPPLWTSKSHALGRTLCDGAQQRRDARGTSTTADVARDIDFIRQAARRAAKLNYFGFSYGTYLGATYATLFPRRYRSMVLDGA